MYSNSPKIAIEAQGGIFALANKHGHAPINLSKRGKVYSFSSASRLRLMRKLARIEHSPKTVFMTLTFPDRYPNPDKAKDHLRALLERFRRRFPQASAVWRMEPQERGAPHFHLLWYNLPYIRFKRLRRWWSQIISEYVEDTEPFVRIEMCRTKRKVRNYVSKYVAKTGDHLYRDYDGSCFLDDGSYLHAGRCWGIHNKEAIPWAVRLYFEFAGASGDQFEAIKALMSLEWRYVPPEPDRGACLFTENAGHFFQNAHFILTMKGTENERRKMHA